MSDLVVKLHELQDSQDALETIMTEFNNVSDAVKKSSDIYSNGHVADAMNSFATNWKDHREKLLKKMEDAHKHSQKCISSWEAADSSLATALETHQSGGPGHSRAE